MTVSTTGPLGTPGGAALSPDVKTSAAIKPSPAVGSREELNAGILRASMDVALSSGNEPLALLYKSAIGGINDLLAAEHGPEALQNAMGQDNTPEGTSGRIVSLSTAFFERYKQQHPGEDEAKLLKDFMHTIRSGVERGFSEARDILQGMKVLSGDIAGNIDKTFELVQKGYDDFEAAELARIDAKQAPQQQAA